MKKLEDSLEVIKKFNKAMEIARQYPVKKLEIIYSSPEYKPAK